MSQENLQDFFSNNLDMLKSQINNLKNNFQKDLESLEEWLNQTNPKSVDKLEIVDQHNQQNIQLEKSNV